MTDNTENTENQQETTPEVDLAERQASPRDAMLEGMYDRLDQQRAEEIGATADAAVEAADQAAQSVAPEVAAAAPVVNEHITKDQMLKVKINGEEKLIPMDKAIQQIQKHEAADIRMSNAAQFERDLKAREELLLANQQAWTTSQQDAQNLLSSTDADGPTLSDSQIEDKAKSVIDGLLTGSSDDAATELADILKAQRPVQNTAPVVDVAEISKQAAAQAKQEIMQAQEQADLEVGYANFKTEYADIVGDANLFAYADQLSNRIADQNPSLTPSQVMMESGKQTRDWLASLSTPQPTGAGRQSVKDKLVPMPAAAPSAKADLGTPEAAVETPRSMLEEIRALRGQGI